jgi:phage gp45-like
MYNSASYRSARFNNLHDGDKSVIAAGGKKMRLEQWTGGRVNDVEVEAVAASRRRC